MRSIKLLLGMMGLAATMLTAHSIAPNAYSSLLDQLAGNKAIRLTGSSAAISPSTLSQVAALAGAAAGSSRMVVVATEDVKVIAGDRKTLSALLGGVAMDPHAIQ